MVDRAQCGSYAYQHRALTLTLTALIEGGSATLPGQHANFNKLTPINGICQDRFARPAPPKASAFPRCLRLYSSGGRTLAHRGEAATSPGLTTSPPRFSRSRQAPRHRSPLRGATGCRSSRGAQQYDPSESLARFDCHVLIRQPARQAVYRVTQGSPSSERRRSSKVPP